MANNAQPPAQPAPTPPPERKSKPRRGGKNNQDRPSWAGKMKLCYRTTEGNWDRPATIWADKRHKTIDAEIAQLQAAKIRVDNNPTIPGIVEWAAIYDCSTSRFGPEILCFKQGAWHSSTGR